MNETDLAATTAPVPVATLKHVFYPVPGHLKLPLLLALLQQAGATEPVLVFMRTKHRARHVGHHLKSIGLRAAAYQGDLPQRRRQAIAAGFLAGKYQVMVATDIAARGLDMPPLTRIINFDMPDTADGYKMRNGCISPTASAAEVLTLITPNDTHMVRQVERLLGAAPERVEVAGFDYQAPPPAPEPEAQAQSPAASQPQAQSPAASQPRSQPSTPAPAVAARRPPVDVLDEEDDAEPGDVDGNVGEGERPRVVQARGQQGRGRSRSNRGRDNRGDRQPAQARNPQDSQEDPPQPEPPAPAPWPPQPVLTHHQLQMQGQQRGGRPGQGQNYRRRSGSQSGTYSSPSYGGGGQPANGNRRVVLPRRLFNRSGS